MTNSAGSSLLDLLRQPRFAALMTARALSASSQWAERTALGWLAVEIGGSAAFLGLIGFLRFAPGVVAAPLGGALTDRGSPVRTLRRTKSSVVALQLGVGALLLTDAMSPVLLALAAAALGLIQGLSAGANKAIIYHVVRPSDLPRAIPFNSTVFNAAGFAGPVVAGAVIWGAGAGALFVLCALATLVLVLVVLTLPAGLGQRHEPPTPGLRAVVSEIGEGVGYLGHASGLRAPMALHALTGMGLKPLVPLLAGLNAAMLGGGAASLGWLTGLHGAGGVAAGIALATLGGAGWGVVLAASILGGAAMAAAGAAGWAAFPLLALAGAAGTVRNAGLQTLIQIRLRPEMRARVMAGYVALGDAGAALGSLLLGLLAAAAGFPAAFAAAGLGAALAALAIGAMARRSDVETAP